MIHMSAYMCMRIVNTLAVRGGLCTRHVGTWTAWAARSPQVKLRMVVDMGLHGILRARDLRPCVFFGRESAKSYVRSIKVM